MILITERASQAIQRVRHERQVPEQKAVRLPKDDSGMLRLTLDRPHTEDLIVRDGDEPLLMVDANLVDQVDDAVLDYQDSNRREPQFTLRRRSEHTGAEQA
jgi:Fe-S cluster assembly iron-binding protein IscA